MEQGSPKSPKSPTGYEKLTEEKPPKSPSRPFRLKFHRMLSTGSLKLGSSGSTPSSPCSEGSRYSFDSDSIEHLKRSGCSSAENSRPNSFTVADKKLLQKEQEKLEKKLRRQHQSSTTWHGSPLSGVQSPQAKPSPDRLKGTTHDLFELLEKAQSSRLDDQRCRLPPYFNQVRND
uniref:Uncharacterized protein n=1 Tax=Anoplophora glabripennis TaxID=217634 RepID=V5GVF0_ANOGL